MGMIILICVIGACFFSGMLYWVWKDSDTQCKEIEKCSKGWKEIFN